MSTAPLPPPPPPPPPKRGLAGFGPLMPWLPIGIAIVAAAIVLPKVLGGGGDPGAASTTTVVIDTTTTLVETTTTEPPATTTEATTTTAGSTTTTWSPGPTTVAGAIIEDRFDGPSRAEPVFGVEFMLWESIASGRGQITSVVGTDGSPQVLPVLYPVELADVVIEFRFRALPVDPTHGVAGLLVFADPPDGGLDRYVLIAVEGGGGSVSIRSFSASGGWSTPTVHPIPTFDVSGFNRMRVEVSGAVLAVSINGDEVAVWDQGFAFASGRVGPTLISANPGDQLRVDDFVVVPLAG